MTWWMNMKQIKTYTVHQNKDYMQVVRCAKGEYADLVRFVLAVFTLLTSRSTASRSANIRRSVVLVNQIWFVDARWRKNGESKPSVRQWWQQRGGGGTSDGVPSAGAAKEGAMWGEEDEVNGGSVEMEKTQTRGGRAKSMAARVTGVWDSRNRVWPDFGAGGADFGKEPFAYGSRRTSRGAGGGRGERRCYRATAAVRSPSWLLPYQAHTVSFSSQSFLKFNLTKYTY